MVKKKKPSVYCLISASNYETLHMMLSISMYRYKTYDPKGFFHFFCSLGLTWRVNYESWISLFFYFRHLPWAKYFVTFSLSCFTVKEIPTS